MFLKFKFILIPLFLLTSAVSDQKIIAEDGDAGDTFGYAVKINHEWVAISANQDEPNGNSSGSVYLYELIDNLIGDEYKIFPEDGSYNDFFGKAIAMSDDYLIVSSVYDDENGYKSGSVYVFSFENGEWLQTQKIYPVDGSPYDRFGYSLDLNSNFLAIGAIFDDEEVDDAGSVYIYKLVNSEWIFYSKIYSNYMLPGNDFGRSLSINEDYLAVHYKNMSIDLIEQGVVDIYKFEGDNCFFLQTISAPDANSYDYFGISLDIDAEILIIGSYYDDDIYNNSGSVYIYDIHDGYFQYKQKLVPDDVYANDNFGISVSINDNWLAVGSIDDDNGINSGSTYIYTIENDSFNLKSKILPDDGNEFDQFSNSVDIFDNSIIIGSKFDDDLGQDSGSAYFYNFKGCSDINACNSGDYLISDDSECIYTSDGFDCDGSCDQLIDECNICGGGGSNGDANLDAQINIIDIILIVDYILYNTNINVCQIDLNQNDIVNITDVVILLENILNYEN